jgi:hypothetical protein
MAERLAKAVHWPQAEQSVGARMLGAPAGPKVAQK